MISKHLFNKNIDPEPGQQKRCYLRPLWKWVAGDKSTLDDVPQTETTIPQTPEEVRYGYSGSWKTRKAGGEPCETATFGKDPYPGKRKSCYIKQDVDVEGYLKNVEDIYTMTAAEHRIEASALGHIAEIKELTRNYADAAARARRVRVLPARRPRPPLPLNYRPPNINPNKSFSGKLKHWKKHAPQWIMDSARSLGIRTRNVTRKAGTWLRNRARNFGRKTRTAIKRVFSRERGA